MKLDFFKEEQYFLYSVWKGFIGSTLYAVYITPVSISEFPFTRSNIEVEELKIEAFITGGATAEIMGKVLRLGDDDKISGYMQNITGKVRMTYIEMTEVFRSNGFHIISSTGGYKYREEFAKRHNIPFMYTINTYDGSIKAIPLK